MNRDLYHEDDFFSRQTPQPSWRAQTQMDQYLDVNLDHQTATKSGKTPGMNKTSPRGFTHDTSKETTDEGRYSFGNISYNKMNKTDRNMAKKYGKLAEIINKRADIESSSPILTQEISVTNHTNHMSSFDKETGLSL